MSYKTCPDCGCRIHEYGCVNCNEQDYIDMQDVYIPPVKTKIRETMSVTVYEILKESKVAFTKHDVSEIGQAVKGYYAGEQPKGLSKLKHTEQYGEDKWTCTVRCYPDSCRPVIESIVVKYFSEKVL